MRSVGKHALAVLLACTGCGDSEPSEDPRLEAGRELYAEYCALCHGESGEGYAADQANALSNQQFLSTASDEFLRQGITRGRPDTVMSAWGEELGGPLSATDVDALVVFIRSWQMVPSINVDAIDVQPGAALLGEAAYGAYCATCHGDDGLGGDYMSVANPEFLANASDGFLWTVIRQGRPKTAMEGYAEQLSAADINDVVALLRSWQKPIDDQPCDMPDDDLAVINPDGAEPPFDADGRYVSVEELKNAYDAGARMLLLDARPPCDYVDDHITGAVSVPFYAAKDRLDELPKDDWIVAYCACPHAEAGAATDVLLANGFTKVKVLDEGLPLWEELGYPLTSGTSP